MTPEQMKEELERLRTENEALKKRAQEIGQSIADGLNELSKDSAKAL